ncbi:batten's disease protein Cln3 [Xylogone sp. PMI_703]|nr:batten's disease protein Cln3 [Xylogone sp. PMI_703]
MERSASASGLLPLPGTPGSSWAIYKARLRGVFQGADMSVLVAFWLFGLINNVLYVIILSAALDLVGPSVPKGVVLLADVVPSFLTKLVAPYFIHKIPYAVRILIFVALSSGGMLLVALTPDEDAGAIATKLFGVILASLSSGGGELSFLGLTHYYGHFSLAAWGSGTGGAGLAGAGLYVLLTTTIGFSVKNSLLASAFLPGIMLFSFFIVLPKRHLYLAQSKGYQDIPSTEIDDENIGDIPPSSAASSLLAPGPSTVSEAYRSYSPRPSSPTHHNSRAIPKPTLMSNLRRARSLFFPYMLPLLLVYIGEYTINQGVAPTLLFPLPSSPFSNYRSFYPFYNFLYQIGVFIARSSTPFVRIHNLYLPSMLQMGNLFLLTTQALWNWIPSVYLVLLVIFWEGLLGGAVYVNTFSEILENIPEEDREFSLGATSVSDSGGICIAGFIGMAMEVWLCNWQVERGRPWCRTLK